MDSTVHAPHSQAGAEEQIIAIPLMGRQAAMGGTPPSPAHSGSRKEASGSRRYMYMTSSAAPASPSARRQSRNKSCIIAAASISTRNRPQGRDSLSFIMFASTKSLSSIKLSLCCIPCAGISLRAERCTRIPW